MNADVKEILRIADMAGKAILEVYGSVFRSKLKEDRSPVTEADTRSHAIIHEQLARSFPGIPILSEEGRSISYEERKNWKRFWIVDPLDGTKEFIKQNGEFTVNIALIEGVQPTVGIVTAPALGLAYGATSKGAFKRDLSGETERIKCSKPEGKKIVVVKSRSHSNEETEKFLRRFQIQEVVSVGSSLKFCFVAEGRAHLYPRLGPMMEWDSAAGVAIVRGAGGTVLAARGDGIEYNTPLLKHESMIASYSVELLRHSDVGISKAGIAT